MDISFVFFYVKTDILVTNLFGCCNVIRKAIP